jgi:hypothetical protein
MPAHDLLWSPSKDKYGRPIQTLRVYRGTRFETVGVVVTLPKAYAAKYGPRYLSNDWSLISPTLNPSTAVAYHATLAAAKARLEAIAL